MGSLGVRLTVSKTIGSLQRFQLLNAKTILLKQLKSERKSTTAILVSRYI